MLVRCRPERALVPPGNFQQTGLEALSGLILDSSVLNEACEVVLAVLAGVPAKVVDVAVEGEWSGWLQLPAQEALDFALERLETHAVNSIFQASVLMDI